MALPTVSITICMRNGGQYIHSTLESVFAQTLQDFEVILVDDGSTDGSADSVERDFPDPRLRIVRQSGQTLRVARPVALAHCTGEFVTFVDHDDLWLPEKLEAQVAAARRHPSAGLVFSDALVIDGGGTETGRLSDAFDPATVDLRAGKAHLALLRHGNFVAYPTAFVRASVLRTIGGFSRDYQYVSDYDLWLRIARRHDLAYIGAPLAKYRVHGQQMTQRSRDITVAEHQVLFGRVVQTASYPRQVRETVGDILFGQQRLATVALWSNRKFAPAARSALALCAAPRRLQYSVRHELRGTFIGSVLEKMAEVTKLIAGTSRTQATPTGRHIWIDGTPLGAGQTGYFHLVAESIRRLTQDSAAGTIVHVVTTTRGRVALRNRLGADGASVRFHRAGWRALHWSQVHDVVFGRSSQLLWLVLTIAALVASIPLAAMFGLSVLAATAFDELASHVAATQGRPRLPWSARLVRFLWRRWPKPRGNAPHGNTTEVIVWRGRFRWTNAHHIAIVQDLTPRMLPEVHTPENVSEFDEFLGYAQRHAQEIVVVSGHTRRDVIDHLHVNPEAVRVLPMPVHPQYVEPVFHSAALGLHGIHGPYILCVGAIEPRKNLRRLVTAFAEVLHRSETRGHRLVLVGPDAWDPTFREWLITSDARAHTQMLGFVPLEHLPALYHHATGVIMPSVYEGFGLPVLEAMCCSSVVMASNISSLPEVLGDAGLLFDPYDTHAIANTISHVIHLDASTAADYRRRSRQRAELHIARVHSEPGL